MFEEGTFLYVNESKSVEQKHLGDHIGFPNKKFISERYEDKEKLIDSSDEE